MGLDFIKIGRRELHPGCNADLQCVVKAVVERFPANAGLAMVPKVFD